MLLFYIVHKQQQKRIP